MKYLQKQGRFLISFIFFLSTVSAWATPTRLKGHVPSQWISRSTDNGRLTQSQEIPMTIALSLRNQSQLADLIKRLHNPTDPMYGHYLTTAQFAAQFGPTSQDIDTVQQYLASHNLKVLGTTTTTMKISGAVSDIETAFNFEMHQYQTKDNRTAYSANNDPEVDDSVSSKITAILGLNNFSKLVAHRQRRALAPRANPVGTGPSGGLAPADIQKAYSFPGGSVNGAGQTLALMELDGYTPSDITAYAQQFNIATTPALQNILIDGFNGAAGSGADEVTLDIELMMAVAPGASQILVYEGMNTETGPTDVYAKIADDNLAKQVSTSWGSPESQNTSAFLNSENSIFMQMASQGQSIYAAAGDSGAYDDGSTLSVDDPSSQPYMVSAGGTSLTLNSDGSYKSETSWGTTDQGQDEGGGGGISSVWPMPSWQAGLATATNKGSTANRMVPDVSLDADPDTGYAIYVGGSWNVYGGTSCAAPLWAAFTALVNQQRATAGLATLGFANMAIYSAGTGASYSQLFHDVNDNSTNLFYPAVTGYDLSTGWGTMIASSLLTNFTGGGAASAPMTSPTNVSATPHNQIATVTWTAVPGAVSYSVARSASNAGPFTVVAPAVSATNYIDTGLQNGTTYFYQVTAKSITSQSPASTAVSVTPAAMVPEAPTQLSAVQVN